MRCLTVRFSGIFGPDWLVSAAKVVVMDRGFCGIRWGCAPKPPTVSGVRIMASPPVNVQRRVGAGLLLIRPYPQRVMFTFQSNSHFSR